MSLSYRDVKEVEQDIKNWVATTKGIAGFKGFMMDNASNYYQTYKSTYGIDHLAWYRKVHFPRLFNSSCTNFFFPAHHNGQVSPGQC